MKKIIQKAVIAVVSFAIMSSIASMPVMVSASGGTRISDLTVNYQTNPLGVEPDKICFAWKMKSDVIGKMQSAYRIKVSTDYEGREIIWDSDKIDSGYSVGIPYSGELLSDAVRYYWTVAVWDEKGVQYSSGQSYFETGVTNDLQWVNTMFVQTHQPSTAAPLFRTEGELEGTVNSARLYAIAAGAYDVYINGRKAQLSDNNTLAEPHMAPGYGSGSLSMRYQTYDVTNFLKGERAFAIVIQAGTGWCDINGEEVFDKTLSRPAVKAMLRIDYTNAEGEKKQLNVSTNTSDWKATLNGPITACGVFYGEDYDARKKQALGSYMLPGYDDGAWSESLVGATYGGNIISDNVLTGKIVDAFEQKPLSVCIYSKAASVSEYIGGEIEVEEYYAREEPKDAMYREAYIKISPEREIFEDGISLRSGQTMIINMGQNITAVPEIIFSGPEGGKARMQFGEILNDGSSVGNGATEADGPKGSMYKKSLRTARAAANYVFSGESTETYQPSMTFFGYQYIEITSDCDINIYSVKSRPLSSVNRQSGTIETNNKDVNRLFLNALFGQLSNSFSTLTDCPQRDERKAWTGDAQVFAQTAVYNFDAMAFMSSYQDTLSEATMHQGYPGAVLALWNFFNHWASGWSDIEIIAPWVMYRQTGDKTILSKHWRAMNRYMLYLKSNERSDYCAPAISRNGFGDWLAFQGTGYEVIADYYYGYVTSLMAQMAQILEDDERAKYYEEQFEELKNTFLENHVTWNAAGVQDDFESFDVPTTSESGVSNVITNRFENVRARYVTITVFHTGPGTADDGEYRLQMMEFEVSDSGGENYAKYATVNTSDNFSWPSESNPSMWGSAFLTDGNHSLGYSSNSHETQDISSNPVKVTIDLGSVKNFNQVDITCRIYDKCMVSGVCANYPHNYELAVSEDGANWMTVGKYVSSQTERCDKLVIKSAAGSSVMQNKGGVYENNSQTALLWMLKLGYYDSEQMREEAIRLLIENIKNENPNQGSVRVNYGKNTLSVGFLGSNVITPVLTDIGRPEVSYDLLLNTEMPSWLFEVRAGATTIWERWNSYDPEKGFGDSEMNSFNHFAYGAIAEWMYRYMAGIAADSERPGFKHIILQPTPDTGEKYNDEERINFVRGVYESYYGKIQSEWHSAEGELTEYYASIPANTSATLYLPVPDEVRGMNQQHGVTLLGFDEHNGHKAAKIELTSGDYNFEIDGEWIKVSTECKVDDGFNISNVSYQDGEVNFNIINGEGIGYNCYVAEHSGDGVLEGAAVLRGSAESEDENITIPYEVSASDGAMKLFVWSDEHQPLTTAYSISEYAVEPDPAKPPEKTSITQRIYYFADDAVKSSGQVNTGDTFEWIISGAPQYFSFGLIDFDAVESITIKSGYQAGSAITSVYAYDSGGAPLNVPELLEFCADETLTGDSIGSIADSKQGEWGYRTATISEDTVIIDEGVNYILSAQSKELTIPESTGVKTLLIGISGNIGTRGYFDSVTIRYKYPVSQ
ncbi:MAG: family 78 glycoside hydrolase catalytic domain [Clostridia bacterium]|nr:family 78 glycoside hydrolase catalytic domain [Clostridia bacterium]